MANSNGKRREYGTGSISQRKDGTWTGRIRIGYTAEGKPQVKAVYGKSEAEVKRKLSAFKKEFAKNDYINVQKNTVGNFMTDWLYNNKVNSLKPKSFDRLEQTIKYQVIPQIGDIQLASIQSSDVQDMVNGLKKSGLSYSTIKKAYDAVNDCFRTAVIQRKVIYNPALGVTLPRKDSFEQSEIKFYTEDEIFLIKNAARSVFANGKRVYRLGDMVVLCLSTGLRLAELTSLKWSDVDFDKKTISVNTTRVVVRDRDEKSDKKYKIIEQYSAKSKSGLRTIPMNDDAIESLENLKNVTGDFTYVLSTKSGDAVSPRYVDRTCRNIEAAAGLPRDKIYGAHALRHTFATQLFAKGINVKVVSELLGHSDITVTYNTYIHVINSQKYDAVSKL